MVYSTKELSKKFYTLNITKNTHIINNKKPRLTAGHWLVLNDGCYSVRRETTGLANAAFNAWKLMVSKAINKASTPAMAKNHHCIDM